MQKSAKYTEFNLDLSDYLLSTGNFALVEMAPFRIIPRGLLGLFKMLLKTEMNHKGRNAVLWEKLFHEV